MAYSTLDFEQTFKSHYSVMCNLANNIIRNKWAAEDIVQDVFLKLWQKKDLLTFHTNFKSYLYRATTNASIDYLKSNRNNIGMIEEAHNDNPEKIVTTKELEVKIESALNNLPPKCKAIFILSRFEGMKYKEIAEHLDISPKTVENQMGIGLEKLRNELKPYLTNEFILKAISIGISLLFPFLFSYFHYFFAALAFS